MLAFEVYEDGAPIRKWPDGFSSRAFCIYLADADNRPRERDFDFDTGRLACYCRPPHRRRLFIRWAVRGFGDPVLRTRLLQPGRRLRNLAVELALGRIELIDSERARGALEGLQPSDALSTKIEQARQAAAEAERLDAADRAAASSLANKSLEIALPAGEELALEFARARLEHRRAAGALRGFMLGCAGFGLDAESVRGRRFLEIFNYATLPFYLSGMEPGPGRVEHGNVLRTARDLHARGLALKGHPLVWTYNKCTPPHRLLLDFPSWCRISRERIARDVPPFRGLIGYWDIINEAHDTPWANSPAFSSEQLVELTGVAAEATRAADPGAKLVVNVCLPFGEYAAGSEGRATTLEYVRACIDSGVDFDVVGVQFYYGGGLLQYCWDMLEISRVLDDYAALGKEVHITELGIPSAMGPDPNAMITEGNDVGLWHCEWSGQTQADWVEQFYTVCMSKPAINALTWWSFSDAAKVFWPHSGLLDRQDEPKESFHRVAALRRMIDQG